MIRIALTFIVLSAICSSAPGFEVGDTVVVVREAEIGVNNFAVDKVFPGLSLNVGAIDGNWLWVSNGHPGWLDIKSVVPLEQGIAALTELIRLDPASPRLYYGRGIVWSSKNELDRAIADFDEAIRLEPNPLYFVGRGIAWNLKGEYDKAVIDCSKAVVADPAIVEAYLNRANARKMQNDYDRAIADYDDVIRLDPDNSIAFNDRGIAWAEKGEFAKALADFKEALRYDAKYANARNQMAWLWATCPDEKYRDGAKAVEFAKKACDLSDWNSTNHLDTLAAAYAEMGNFSEAKKWEQKAIDLAAEAQKPDFRARLKLYSQSKPYRQEVK